MVGEDLSIFSISNSVSNSLFQRTPYCILAYFLLYSITMCPPFAAAADAVSSCHFWRLLCSSLFCCNLWHLLCFVIFGDTSILSCFVAICDTCLFRYVVFGDTSVVYCFVAICPEFILLS